MYIEIRRYEQKKKGHYEWKGYKLTRIGTYGTFLILILLLIVIKVIVGDRDRDNTMYQVPQGNSCECAGRRRKMNKLCITITSITVYSIVLQCTAILFKSQPETEIIIQICDKGCLNIYSEQITAEKNLHSWTNFAVSDDCVLDKRSSDICSQPHERVSLGFSL